MPAYRAAEMLKAFHRARDRDRLAPTDSKAKPKVLMVSETTHRALRITSAIYDTTVQDLTEALLSHCLTRLESGEIDIDDL